MPPPPVPVLAEAEPADTVGLADRVADEAGEHVLARRRRGPSPSQRQTRYVDCCRSIAGNLRERRGRSACNRTRSRGPAALAAGSAPSSCCGRRRRGRRAQTRRGVPDPRAASGQLRPPNRRRLCLGGRPRDLERASHPDRLSGHGLERAPVERRAPPAWAGKDALSGRRRGSGARRPASRPAAPHRRSARRRLPAPGGTSPVDTTERRAPASRSCPEAVRGRRRRRKPSRPRPDEEDRRPRALAGARGRVGQRALEVEDARGGDAVELVEGPPDAGRVDLVGDDRHLPVGGEQGHLRRRGQGAEHGVERGALVDAIDGGHRRRGFGHEHDVGGAGGGRGSNQQMMKGVSGRPSRERFG